MNFHSPVLPELLKEFHIGTNKIGYGHPCYVIAEAGSNHNRDLKTAIALIDAAADAGCDAIKFQTFTGEDIASSYQSEMTKLGPEFARWGSNLQELYKHCALVEHMRRVYTGLISAKTGTQLNAVKLSEETP